MTNRNLAPPKILFCFLCLIVLATKAVSQEIQQPFITDRVQLKTSKDLIRKKDPAYLNALNKLRQKADLALKNGPYSVTYKEKAPPGGTKHDYYSVGPYWWPDSTKPDGLPYIRKDGQVNPERTANKDASYHSALCNDTYILGLAWYFTGDERYANHAVHLLRVWFLNENTRMNPHLNFGQAIPGITTGRGIGLIDTHNLVYLIDGVQLLSSSDALDRQTYLGIRKWYAEFLEWMLNSPIGKDEARQHNNHGTYYDVQAVSMALFTGQPEIAKEVIRNKSLERIDKQLAEDGSQPHELVRTLSWSYSQMNLNGFFELALLAENVDIDLWNYESPSGKKIKEAFMWMLPYAEGKKPWTHQQIKPINRATYLKTAYIAAQKYPDSHLDTLWKANVRPDNEILFLARSLF